MWAFSFFLKFKIMIYNLSKLYCPPKKRHQLAVTDKLLGGGRGGEGGRKKERKKKNNIKTFLNSFFLEIFLDEFFQAQRALNAISKFMKASTKVELWLFKIRIVTGL